MNKPKVSIVIPAFNAERHIARALNSVLEQSFSSWEMIVVNDGSTDRTREIAESYAQNNVRIRTISHESNRERSSARNTGLRLAVGDYISFLDSDDCWLPSKLAEQINFFDKFPEVNATFTGIEIIDENENVVEPWSEIYKKYPNSYVTALMLIQKGNIVVGSASTVMIRRSLQDKVGYFDESMNAAEDLDYWYRIAKFSTLVCIPYSLVQIRQHEDASLQTDSSNLLTGKLMFVEKVKKDFPEGLLPELKSFEIETLYRLIAVYWHSHDLKKSIILFIKLFGKYPWNAIRQISLTIMRKFSNKERCSG